MVKRSSNITISISMGETWGSRTAHPHLAQILLVMGPVLGALRRERTILLAYGCHQSMGNPSLSPTGDLAGSIQP